MDEAMSEMQNGGSCPIEGLPMRKRVLGLVKADKAVQVRIP